MRALIRKAEREADAADAREPQVIVTCDPRTGRKHATGIYPNRAAALEGLVRLRASNLKADPEFADLVYEVMPFFPIED